MRAPIDFETEAFETLLEGETPDAVSSITSSWIQQAAIRGALRAGNEQLAVRFAIASGVRDENKLTDLIFNIRHPERQGRRLESHEQQLIREWLDIRDRLIRGALRAFSVSSAAGVSPIPDLSFRIVTCSRSAS
jgi:hypothetical protein